MRKSGIKGKMSSAIKEAKEFGTVGDKQLKAILGGPYIEQFSNVLLCISITIKYTLFPFSTCNVAFILLISTGWCPG